MISVFGANLSDTTQVGPSAVLAQTLGGVSLTVNARILPLFFVSPSQINALLPVSYTHLTLPTNREV